MLRIVADENIPFAREAFGAYGEVALRPGREIKRADLRSADVLLARSVTRVDEALLEGTPVRFVGSATIGTDHVDRAYLSDRGVAFAHAPGSNADSVVEYVLAALLCVAVRRGEPLRGKTAGIVGCGHIGGRLAARLPALGLRVLRNDPPRAAQAETAGSPGGAFLPLEEVLAGADVVTIHVPLTREGPHPTLGLFDAPTLALMRPGAWLLNTARGPVVRADALLRGLEQTRPGTAVLDVWEDEPAPSPLLVRRVALGTAHIAGYSYDGKVTGTVMLYRALRAHLGLPPAWDEEAAFAPGPEDRLLLRAPGRPLPETAWLDALVRQMYDIADDDRLLRGLLALPAGAHAAYFSRLRKQYPRRRTFSRHRLPLRDVPEPYREAVEKGLGVRVADA